MFATLYDRSNAHPPPAVRRKPEPENSESYADIRARTGHLELQVAGSQASYPAGVPSSGTAKGSILYKDAFSSESWLSESRLRYQKHEGTVRCHPIRPTDSQIAATPHCTVDFRCAVQHVVEEHEQCRANEQEVKSYRTTNRDAFKLPEASDYPTRHRAPMNSSPKEVDVKTNAFKTTYTESMCSQQYHKAPSTRAGGLVSRVPRYHIIHGGAPHPNNHRFETFDGHMVHRKRPPAAVRSLDV